MSSASSATVYAQSNGVVSLGNLGIVPIVSTRDPATTDVRGPNGPYKIGQIWINTVDDDSFVLSSFTTTSGVTSATWTSQSAAAGSVSELDGDSGTATPSGGAITIAGTGTVATSAAGSTVTIDASVAGHPVTPFVVGSDGGYATVQEGVTAANVAGGGLVFVQPGTYTEDLTLYDNVNLYGAAYADVTIAGTHTPPASGAIIFENLTLTDASAIFSSAAAGTTNISVINCEIAVTNGFTFDLANWTGTLEVGESGANGTNDGFSNNTGGAQIVVNASEIGNGSGQTMITSGTLLLFNTIIGCPIDCQTGSILQIDGCRFNGALTFSNDTTGYISTSYLSTGASAAITMSSSANISLNAVAINSSNNPAIAGAGAGTLTLNSVNFLNNAELAATLTLSEGETRGGNSISRFIVGSSPDAVYQTVQSAITAANAAGGGVVFIQPGSYTEDLTLFNNVDIVGNSYAQVTITGAHTPPDSGDVLITKCTLASTTDIFSSAAAGSTNISVIDCELNVTNGFVFDLDNWTGTLEIGECGANGTNDGFVNNSGGSTIVANASEFGAGSGQTMVTSGTLLLFNCIGSCPIDCQTGSILQIDGCRFNGALTFSNDTTGYISTSYLSTGASAAITMSSSANISLNAVAINSSNNPAIAGAGAGTLTLNSVNFLNNAELAATLTLSEGETRGGNSISRFIVGSSPDAVYQTVQSAITAANAAGGGVVFVQPGTYTEDLTLFNNCPIFGSSYDVVTITGAHTPPATGTFMFQNCTLTSATDIFSSAAAGSATLQVINCEITVTNGFVFDLPNWTGTLAIGESGSSGTHDGFVNNTGGATIIANSSEIGIGTSQTMVTSGTILMVHCEVDCPIDMQTGSSFTINDCSFADAITLSNDSTGIFNSCSWSTGAAASITMSSSANVSVLNSVITSSNSPAIDGAGAGTLTLGDITFTSDATQAGTLTVAWADTQMGDTGVTGNLTFTAAGNKIISTSVATTTTAGANSFGSVTLASGTATVATSAVTTNSLIYIWRQSIGSTGAAALGHLSVGTITNGVSFVVSALQAADATAAQTTDVSVVGWMIVN